MMIWKSIAAIGVGAVAIAGLVAVVDEYFRQEIKGRVEAEYFDGFRKRVGEYAKKKLEENSLWCDVPEGVVVARDFIDRGRTYTKLQTIEPAWGWEKQHYRFIIYFQSKKAVEFALTRQMILS